jgi:hypothetical protein
MKTFLSLLISIFCISISFAQTDFYSNPKFSFGNITTIYHYNRDSVVMEKSYNCSPVYRTDKEYLPVPFSEATGYNENEFKPDDFAPYRDEFIESTFSDKLGDTVMVICKENKYWATIKSIGVFNDYCMGFMPICKLASVDSMPQPDSTSYANLIVLRKGAYYNGRIYKINELATPNPIEKYCIDSLKAAFSRLNADSLFSDSNVIKSFLVDYPPKSIFLPCYRFRDGAMYFSALYEIVDDSRSAKVVTLQDPAAVGYREWKFISAFDFDNDGVLEYFISTIGRENETVNIFTSKNGEWVQLYSVFFHGCESEE